MSTYAATAERDGKFWFVRVTGPDFDYATQARNLREVDLMARDLVATVLDIDPESVQVDVTVLLPESARSHLSNAERLRAEAARANASAANEARAAAKELAESGLTLRDIGQALGVSYQRAHQLVRS